MKKDRIDENNHLDKQQNVLNQAKQHLEDTPLSEEANSSLAFSRALLDNMFAIEHGELRPAHEVLGLDFIDFPPADSLTDNQVKDKLDLLIRMMAEHDAYLALLAELPIRVIYKYLTEDFLYEEIQILGNGWTFRIDGCDGYCPGCFQVNYCEIARENWNPDDLK